MEQLLLCILSIYENIISYFVCKWLDEKIK